MIIEVMFLIDYAFFSTKNYIHLSLKFKNKHNQNLEH